jgi:hypothetical protein
MEGSYLKFIFILLVAAYFSDQLNQFYNFNILGFQNVISKSSKDLIETIVELGISFFSFYILFNFNIEPIVIRFVLLLFSIFYLINGLASLLLFTNIGGYRNAVSKINYEIFITEYLITKIGSITLFYLLYKTLF